MSKKIKTIEELEGILQEDLGWRKKEMLVMRILVSKDKNNEPTLLRSCMALLCAHFEGFIKFAANSYLKYVSAQEIPNKSLKNNFMAFKLMDAFKLCEQSAKNSVYQRLISQFDELSSETFMIKKDVVSTHSNPSSDEIKEILDSIGVETDIFALKKRYIDAELLSNRHKVVHGERFPINRDEFDATFQIIMQLLDDFYQVIVEAAESKKYMKESALKYEQTRSNTNAG